MGDDIFIYIYDEHGIPLKALGLMHCSDLNACPVFFAGYLADMNALGPCVTEPFFNRVKGGGFFPKSLKLFFGLLLIKVPELGIGEDVFIIIDAERVRQFLEYLVGVICHSQCPRSEISHPGPNVLFRSLILPGSVFFQITCCRKHTFCGIFA